MEIQPTSSVATGIPVPPPPSIPTTAPPSSEQPKSPALPKLTASEPSFRTLLLKAESLWKAGKAKRVELGLVLIQLHALRSKKGTGTFLASCVAIGITKTTAYEYMKDAGWVRSGTDKKPQRVRQKAGRSSTSKSAGTAELKLDASEDQKKILRKLTKENPSALNRVVLEAIRVLEKYGEKPALAALGNSWNEYSKANSLARGNPVQQDMASPPHRAEDASPSSI